MIPEGRRFLAGYSWWAIPGRQFLAQLRKGKGKRKQSDGLIVMYFFDWVVGVIRYGLPALYDSEDRVIASEVETKTILMGHPTSCCHAPVVRSFFIHCKMIISPEVFCYYHLTVLVKIVCTRVKMGHLLPKIRLVLM